jgi:hypothetical protein
MNEGEQSQSTSEAAAETPEESSPLADLAGGTPAADTDAENIG